MFAARRVAPLAAVALALVAGACALCQSDAPNYARPEQGGTVTGPRNSSESAGRPQVANDGLFDGYAWAPFDVPLVVQFDRPRTISVVDMLLYHEAAEWYQFVVDVSADEFTWTRVGERQSGQPRGWQRVDFPARECRQVRITFTATSVETRSYHVVEIGAFLLTPRRPSPLRAAREQARVADGASWDAVLLRALGDHAAMGREQAARVLAAPAGQRLTTDLDGDGDPDLSDYLDTDPRNTIRPIVVRAIDDDDDMTADGAPDADSDCLVADWRGDGRVDRAIDYWDDDGDGDADRMDLYYAAGGWHGNQVEVVVVRDIGDDNRMWATRNYEYQQYTCQWDSDFNGDEIFCMFAFNRAGVATAWLEEPFTHHDLDGDGVAELTIQFLGRGPDVDTIRYSFDADNDSNLLTNRRDYDFSLNCAGRLAVPEECQVRYALRNGEQTGPSLDWKNARAQAEAGAWRSCSLCWDEIDHNVNPADGLERNWERWEGVGGYPMNEGNKRWETDRDYSGKMALYYWPADRRLHLLGAETGYINLDADHDGRVEARLTYADRDGDGYFDQWSYDADADGRADHIAAPVGAPPELVPIDYDRFPGRYRRWVSEALADDGRLIDALHGLLGPAAVSPAEQWWVQERPASFYAAAKLGASAEARRYYLDMAREQLFMQAWGQYRAASWWQAFRTAYETGDHGGAAGILEKVPPGAGRGESGG